MSVVTQTPLNPAIFPNVGTVTSGDANLLRGKFNTMLGSIEDKSQLTQAYLEGMHLAAGYGSLGGGALSAGVGLNVIIAAHTAIVGNRVETNASSTVGVTASATNYLWARQDGTFTANTSGVPPGTADGHGTALAWGQATTSGIAVTAVDQSRLFFYGCAGLFQTKFYNANAALPATGERIALVDPGAGTVIITLPTIALGLQPITVKHVGSGAGTVLITGGANIDNAATATLTSLQFRQLVTNGTAWYVVSS